MRKIFLFFTALVFGAGTLAAQTEEPELTHPPTPATREDKDTAFFVVHTRGKWVGMEALVITKESHEGQAVLRHTYECQLASEAGMGFTSARGECRFVADTYALIEGTLTKFNEEVTLLDVQLKREKTKLITTALGGARIPPREASLQPDTKLAAPWMAEQLIMANQPLSRDMMISYIEFTGDLASPTGTREVSISIIRDQERTIGRRQVRGWQAEMLFPTDREAQPVQLFLDSTGRILEKVYGETVFTRVATREETRLAGTSEFEQRGRRDPFAPRLVYVG